MGTYSERIETKLRVAFQPARLDVIDDSNRHAGHVGAHPSGETHFNVVMEAATFAGKSRVERQRLVYQALESELREHVHALSLKLSAPGEG